MLAKDLVSPYCSTKEMLLSGLEQAGVINYDYENKIKCKM